jgi:hypothetical protein
VKGKNLLSAELCTSLDYKPRCTGNTCLSIRAQVRHAAPDQGFLISGDTGVLSIGRLRAADSVRAPEGQVCG